MDGLNTTIVVLVDINNSLRYVKTNFHLNVQNVKRKEKNKVTHYIIEEE